MNMIDSQQRAPLSEYAQSSKPTPTHLNGLIFVIIITSLFLILPGIIFIANPWVFSGPFTVVSPGINLTQIIISLIVFCSIIFLLYLIGSAIWERRKVRKAIEPWLDRNDLDFVTSKTIQTQLVALLSSPRSTVNPSDPKIRVCQNLRLGEISRHFDSQTKATIAGWLDHQLGINGWGAGLQVGNVRLGVGKVGITGQSQAIFVLSGTTRDNLLGDGFVAVLEQDGYGGLVDTVRVVVPSEPAIRELVERFMDGLSAMFYRTSYCGNVFSANTALVQQLINVSYVSDRLSAILRMPPERRPRVSVIGTKINEHAIIGDMIWIENDRGYDDRGYYTLFPIHLLTEIDKIAIQA